MKHRCSRSQKENGWAQFPVPLNERGARGSGRPWNVSCVSESFILDDWSDTGWDFWSELQIKHWHTTHDSTYFLRTRWAISDWTLRYSWAILMCCSNTAMDSLEFGHGARGWKNTGRGPNRPQLGSTCPELNHRFTTSLSNPTTSTYISCDHTVKTDHKHVRRRRRRRNNNNNNTQT